VDYKPTLINLIITCKSTVSNYRYSVIIRKINIISIVLYETILFKFNVLLVVMSCILKDNISRRNYIGKGYVSSNNINLVLIYCPFV